MANKQKDLQNSVLKITRVHFFLSAAVAAQIIIFHAWQLITPEAVLSRWIALSLFFLAVTTIWLFAKKTNSSVRPQTLVFWLVTADILLASYSVYTQRGMAARAVALYAVPIAVTAVLRSRSAAIATAAASAAAYTVATLSYFVLHFNEGYKIELYGEVGFYVATFFILSSCLWISVRRPD